MAMLNKRNIYSTIHLYVAHRHTPCVIKHFYKFVFIKNYKFVAMKAPRARYEVPTIF